MKIIVNETNFVIKSRHSLATIRRVAAEKPEALVLRDENKNALFAIAAAANGGLNSVGITFNKAGLDGKAVLELHLPNVEHAQLKSAIAKMVGTKLALAQQIESQIDTAIAQIQTEVDAVEAMIDLPDLTETNTAENQ